MPLRFASIVVALALAACGVPETGAKRRSPTQLVAGFSSFQTPVEARRALGTERWSVVREASSPARGRCPRFDSLGVSAKRWSHLGHSGELQLSFTNEVLTQAVFYPDDPEGYVQALGRMGLVFDRLSSTGVPYARQSLRTEVRHWRNHEGRYYVAWVDTALEYEQGRWIRACS